MYKTLGKTHLTFHQLQTVILDIERNLNNNTLSGVVFLDIRKAFDSIDHTILLQKMHDQFGIKNVELDWFKSYLTNREQACIVNGAMSSVLCAEFRRDQFLVPCCFYYILMIYPNASKKLRHTYTLMILKFLLLPKLLRNLLKI